MREKQVHRSVDSFVRSMMGVGTLTVGVIDVQYCFYVNLLWSMDREARDTLMDSYRGIVAQGYKGVVTLTQIRLRCSGIFLEKVPETSAKTLGEVLETLPGEGW